MYEDDFYVNFEGFDSTVAANVASKRRVGARTMIGCVQLPLRDGGRAEVTTLLKLSGGCMKFQEVPACARTRDSVSYHAVYQSNLEHYHAHFQHKPRTRISSKPEIG